MNRFRRLQSLGAVTLIGAAILGAPSRAQATFKLTIADSDGNSVTAIDQGANDLDPAHSGRIVYSGGLGVFDIALDTGTSNSPGTPNLAQLTINSTSISSNGFTGDKTLTITLQDDGFTQPQSGAVTSQISATQLPGGSKVEFQSFLNGNAGTKLTLNGIGGASTQDLLTNGTNPYTLKDVTTITFHGLGLNQGLTVQTTGLTAVTPAPAGLVLALSGVPFLSLAWLRRRKAVEPSVAA